MYGSFFRVSQCGVPLLPAASEGYLDVGMVNLRSGDQDRETISAIATRCSTDENMRSRILVPSTLKIEKK